MEYLKFIPEGWNEENQNVNLESIKSALDTGKIMQGKVYECDSNFNLYVKLGENLTGIIPRNEVDFITCDEYGFTKPSICLNKVNSYVQFKVKEVHSDNQIILSRKKANEEALNWMNENLKERSSCKRNCKKYSKIWCICRNRSWSYRTFAY